MKESSNGVEGTFKRRQVLSGVGGVMAGSLIGLPKGSEDLSPAEVAERLAPEFDGVTTAEDRGELAYLIAELRKDSQLLAGRDPRSFPTAKRAEFAEKGRRMKELMVGPSGGSGTYDGDCGFEGAEVEGVTSEKQDECCTQHDKCEAQDGGGMWDDSVFNGDECDEEFWNCLGS